jgi:hypothetical protein
LQERPPSACRRREIFFQIFDVHRGFAHGQRLYRDRPNGARPIRLRMERDSRRRFATLKVRVCAPEQTRIIQAARPGAAFYRSWQTGSFRPARRTFLDRLRRVVHVHFRGAIESI